MRSRTHNVMVRMNDDEYEVFNKNIKESGQTKQAYVTNAVLHVPVMSEEELIEVKNISQIMENDNRQLRGIAANINQMTKRLNGSGEVPQVKELERILRLIENMREESEIPWQLIRLFLSRQKVMLD